MAGKKKKKKKQHRFFWFVIKLQIFLMILVLGAVGYYYYGGYATEVQDLRKEAIKMVNESDKNTFVPSRISTLYDANGNVISETKTVKKAEYVEYEDIPAYFVTAMVSIEDKKFYRHDGIDYKAILRAAKAIVQDRTISQGGSTITMQLARTIYLDTGKTWQRKVKEMFIAVELEKRYSKNQIMEFYLNNIYFANGYYGIQAAAKGYFDCDISELDLSQIAFLCAIPNSPTYYDPLVNSDHTITRRNRILRNMYEDGKISDEVYAQAINEQIIMNVPQKQNVEINNYVDTYAYYCATRALMENEGFEFKYYFSSDEEEKKYDEEYDEMYAYCQKQLYGGGYKVYTSIDMEKQGLLQTALDETLAGFTDTNDEGIYKMQGSAVCIDNTTGLVVAIVGGRSQEFSGYTLNRAYQSHRQPGSSIKPLIVYTPSLERGYTPDSIVNDHQFEGGPSNASGTYHGDVTLRFAVEQSLNTVAWQLYEELTPAVGLEYLKKMDFTAIKADDYISATALGGFTNGVSALEMASAYRTLENNGLYRKPTCIVKIIDSDENTIYESEQVEAVIYSENAARMMTDILTGVMETGTGRNLKLSQMPCAGKTGTTNDLKDGWFCGFTRYYTTSVWVGCDIPEPVTGLTGSSYPGTIWNTYMENIHQGLAVLDFLPYAQLSDEFVENHNAQNPENDNENAQNEDPDENVGENPQNAEIGEDAGENPQNAETGENTGENPQNAGTGENAGENPQNPEIGENTGDNSQNAGTGGNTGDNLPNVENIEGTDSNAGNVVGP